MKRLLELAMVGAFAPLLLGFGVLEKRDAEHLTEKVIHPIGCH